MSLGDRVALDYFRPRSDGGLYAEDRHEFRLAAIVTPFLHLHMTYSSLALGAELGILTSAAAVVISVWKIGLLSPQRLMAGTAGQAGRGTRLCKRKKYGFLFSVPGLRVLFNREEEPVLSCAVLLLCAVLGILAVFLLSSVGEEFQAGAFFAAGTVVLAVLLTSVWKFLKRFTAGRLVEIGRGNVLRLAAAGVARHSGRSMLTMGLMAAAFFLIVAVGAFRRDPLGERPRLDAADGGFSLFVRSELPIYHDLGTAAGRASMGFSPEELRLLARCKIFSLRMQRGDDASCLNLYRPGRPSVLGVPRGLIERGGFKWSHAAYGFAKNPWQALETTTDGATPVVLERNTAKYALHVGGVGTGFSIEDAQGRVMEFKIAGLLAESLFQGYLLVDERAFERLFPETSGYGIFLVDVPCGADGDEQKHRRDVAAVRAALLRALEDYGATVETTGRRLAALAVVQNTYWRPPRRLWMLCGGSDVIRQRAQQKSRLRLRKTGGQAFLPVLRTDIGSLSFTDRYG